jgi:hypothetical protein
MLSSLNQVQKAQEMVRELSGAGKMNGRTRSIDLTVMELFMEK